MLIRFLKDQIGFIFTYGLNFFLIVLFYQLSTDKTVEILYPLLITLFFLGVFLVAKYYKYSQFNKRLSLVRLGKGMYIHGYTNEEKEMCKVVEEMEQQYFETINKIKSYNLKKNKFISQWIHNMKTPVSVIDLILQRSKMNELSIDEAVKAINEENARLNTDLEQVLEILRLEDFSKDYIPEEINLKSLIKEIVNEKKNQFIYNNVYPKLELDDKIVILTDKKWNKVMLGQLISNGIKYSADKIIKKEIIFNARRIENKVILSIKDNGIGIPSYDIPRIFEAFFTGENGRKYKNSSGIGLYIVKEIAEKLSLEINIVSNEGQGTSFEITYLSKL